MFRYCRIRVGFCTDVMLFHADLAPADWHSWLPLTFMITCILFLANFMYGDVLGPVTHHWLRKRCCYLTKPRLKAVFHSVPLGFSLQFNPVSIKGKIMVSCEISALLKYIRFLQQYKERSLLLSRRT